MTVELLLVEDDKADAMLLLEAMERVEFDSIVHHVLDGKDAVDYLENPNSPRPDMVLLDLNMPRMNGHEVLEWIKKDEDRKDIPVGIFTTSSDENDIKKAYKNQASYYITKPTNFDELTAVADAINNFWSKTVKLPAKNQKH